MNDVDGGSGVLLGIDGGNTKSIALIAGPDGSVLGAGRSAGSSDLHLVALEEALARLDEAAGAALTMATAQLGKVETGVDARPRVIAAAFSLAGADWPEDFELVEPPLRERWGSVSVANDAMGALRAAIPSGPGVVVACGTGAATAARGADGRTWHSSFWQLTQGAHALGVQGLEAIVRATLGAGPHTALTAAILDALGEPTVEAVLHRMTGRATKARREQSSIAPVVLDCAEAGDEVALAIVREHGRDLGLIAAAAARRVGIEGMPFTLALTGGVLRHDGRTLRDTLTATVLERSPDARIIRPTLEPAAGALLLAFDAAGIPVTPAIDARLHATMPPADLFETHPVRSR